METTQIASVRWPGSGGGKPPARRGSPVSSLDCGASRRLLFLALAGLVNEIECHRRSLEPLSPIINKVVDANKQAIPYVYGHAHKRDAEITKSMTSPHWQKLFDVVDHSDKKECKD
jgi:hypothetical protein